MSTPSLHSPKNRYFAELHISPASPTLGSVLSYGAMTLEGALNIARTEAAKLTGRKVTITVRENKATYPSFDWQEVRKEDFTISQHGGFRPGSGRKASGKASTTVAFRVSPETKEKMDKLKEDGVDVRRKFEELVKELAD